MFYQYLILVISVMYVSYCYVSYTVSVVSQSRKHASLVKYVCAGETRIPRDACAGNILPGETRIPMTPRYYLSIRRIGAGYSISILRIDFSSFSVLIVIYYGIFTIFATDSGDSVPSIINLHSFV